MALKSITRKEMQDMLSSGRKLVWATLYDRKDYRVVLSRPIPPARGMELIRFIRDVTNEPSHHTRPIIGQK